LSTGNVYKGKLFHTFDRKKAIMPGQYRLKIDLNVI